MGNKGQRLTDLGYDKTGFSQGWHDRNRKVFDLFQGRDQSVGRLLIILQYQDPLHLIFRGKPILPDRSRVPASKHLAGF
jgi:hypothetical protein